MPALISTENLEKLFLIKDKEEQEDSLSAKERGWLKRLYMDQEIFTIYGDMLAYEIKMELDTRPNAYLVELDLVDERLDETPLVQRFVKQFELNENYEPPVVNDCGLVQLRFDSSESAANFFAQCEKKKEHFCLHMPTGDTYTANPKQEESPDKLIIVLARKKAQR